MLVGRVVSDDRLLVGRVVSDDRVLVGQVVSGRKSGSGFRVRVVSQGESEALLPQPQPHHA